MTAGLAVRELRFEHRADALGIGASRPRLSWIAETSIPNWRQTAYEIELLGAAPTLIRVDSDESNLIPWPFEPLRSRERVAVRVRIHGADGSISDWSDPAWAEAGLLDRNDWSANFITPDWDEDTSRAQPSPHLRRTFDLRPNVVKARLYITGHGVFEPYLNGEPVGDHILDPGWTSYHHRLRYQTFDVTAHLRPGPNVLGAIVGDGWFRGRLGFGGGHRNVYGDRLALLAQLEVEYADGSTERIVTDDHWRAATGPILASDIYDGEEYDARLERPGWAAPGYDDADWSRVRVVEADLGILFAPTGPPVRRTQLVSPTAITRSLSGKTIVDFGQNLVGRVRLTVNGLAGQTITLRHAEVLEHGELCTRPLRAAKATDHYTLRGGGPETWEPRFTFHGFRYVEIDGWPGEPRTEDLVAVVCHSDLERRGWFGCSDPLIERLHENVVWSMRGNFLDLPTDCPQRDERVGWTGDIQVFAPTACFLYDTAGFLQSWLADVAAEQDERGVVPFFVPSLFPQPLPPTAAWGDAAVIGPWVLYQRYGDPQILAAQLHSMRAWVDHLAEVAGPSRLWESGYQWGDWLDATAPPDRPAAGRTSAGIVATAYFARSSELLGRALEVLGDENESRRYLTLADEIRAAFAREYVSPTGRVASDSQTGYALAIEFGLLTAPAQRQHAGERLVQLVREGGFHVTTGFVGTPLICDALCAAGEPEVAFHLLTERGCPSWLYPVTMGATTIWERWDSLLQDGTVNPGEMTSFNHYALGAIADFLHRYVAGLAPAAPAYRRIAIAPHPGGGLTHARARHRTPYGIAEVGWRLADGQLHVEATVPPNTSAVVTLPGRESLEVGSGEHRWSCPWSPTVQSRLTLDSSVGDLLDDPNAWAAAAFAVSRLNRDEVRIRTQRHLTLRQMAASFPDPEKTEAQLAALLERLAAQRGV
jgi:alpha-L-rhamnosidase